jgi:hypothetical protein
LKPLFSSYLIAGLFAAFTAIAAAGVLLVFIAVSTPGAAAKADVPQSKVGMTVAPGKLKVDITTGIPGLIIFMLGGVGLLLLAIRVPMKQVRGYRNPPQLPPGAMGIMRMDFLMGPQPILSGETERVPLLLSWFAGDRAVRV